MTITTDGALTPCDRAPLTDAEVCQHFIAGRDTLFVWFSGVNEPFFSANFPVLSEFDCLYFRDTRAAWYTRGLNEALPDFARLASWLGGFAETYKSVIFCGQSSGGYAALRYGLACQVPLCIVFAPQIRNMFDGRCHMSPNVPLVDLYPLFKGAQARRPRVILNVSRSEEGHAGEFEWQDLRQIEKFRTLDRVTTIVHPYDDHSTSVLLRRDELLYRFLIGMVNAYGRS